MGSMGFPMLTVAERDRRWKIIRGEMAEKGIDCLIVAGNQSNWGGNMANCRYLTGIGDMGFCIFPRGAEPTLLTWWTGPYEARRAKETSELTKKLWSEAGKRKPVRSPWALAEPWVSDIRQAGLYWSEEIVRRIRELGLEKGNIALVGTSQDWEPEGIFPHTTYVKLRRELPSANIIDDATPMLEKARLRKSAEEIKCIEKAAEIADSGIEAMVETARQGVSELKVYARIVQRMLEEGSERFLMIYWNSGPTPTHVALFAPPDRPFEKGDLIQNEITPRYGGYVAHPHQPVSIGEPRKEYQEMFALLVVVFKKGLQALKPGMTVGQLEDMLTKPIVEAGYSYLHCPFHGLGLSGLEMPVARFHSNSPITPSDRSLRFEEGMILAYEPMISTTDRKIGIPLGDTVVITSNGARGLSRYAKEIIVV